MDQNIVESIKSGKVGVLPTDTLYGLVGLAFDKGAVERIYQLKKRDPKKPFIILISKVEDLQKFGITISKETKRILKKIWPNPLSIILPCKNEQLSYLHRGTKTLAFRMPNYPELLELLKKTGPLVAPSANTEGDKPAETIDEARAYFADQADFYVDRGKLTGKPSTLVKLENTEFIVLREGSYHLPENF